MDAKQIRDYTALVRRRAEIVLCFGKSWTQELGFCRKIIS